MTRRHQLKGFTLVELAIVLTIIGLLIGGILKGQQLIQNARITSTISQINAIESATTTFRDTYGAMPGDILGAPSRIPDCSNCGLAVAATAGDGIVGDPLWDGTTFQSASFAGGAAAGTMANETVLFWIELSKAGLLAGIMPDGINGVTASWGRSLPAARVGSGFVVGHASASMVMPGRTVAANMTGTVLALAAALATPIASNVAGAQVLTPATAAQIDRKMDDGQPSSGSVQAYGLPASCYSVVAPASASNPGYLENVTIKDCGLYIRIQG